MIDNIQDVELFEMNTNAWVGTTMFSTISIAERANHPKIKILLNIFLYVRYYNSTKL